MAREYTIGEVAGLLQVSCDTLRFYEKKGLIAPEKKENGYRYYSEENIRMLLDLLFWRKIQCSLQDIQTMYEDGTPESLQEMLVSRIKEEKERIRMHQQLLRQMEVSLHNSEKLQDGIGSCSVRPTPKTYIISDIYSDFDAVRNAWFQAVKAAPGLEHCYIHEQFRPGKDGAWEHLCYLVLEDYAVKKLKLEKLLEAKPSYRFERCVHLVERSETISPGQETVEHMKRWAEENGLSLTGEIHAHYLWNQHSAGKLTSSYIEIDMPIR